MYTKIVLTVIAVFLGILALRPAFQPEAVRAQERYPFLQFDEGISELFAANGQQSAVGRVAVDLRTGNIYGFPADPIGYPRDPAKRGVPTSDPVLLGRFNIDKLSPEPAR